jgi:spore maturation protein CgeB
MTVVTEPGAEVEQEASDLVERMQRAASDLRVATESELAVADDALRSRRARREPPRVLIAGPEFGYLSDLIAGGLRACDASVEVRPGDTRTPRGLRVHDWVRDIGMLSPDIVIWMNRPELSRTGSEILRALEIVNVLWSVDSPYRMSLSRTDLGPLDLFLSFDATYLSAAAALGATRSAQLSLAVGIRPLPGVSPDDERWPARLGPDISFVGSLGEGRVRDLRDVLRRQSPQMLSLLERLATEEADPGAAYEKVTGQRYEGAPCFYVQEIRSQRRRVEVLDAFPQDSLKIFGGFDWAVTKSTLAAHHAGRPPRYGYELASIYYHSRINLNVFHHQCVDSTNSRVYDVLAAGGFLLTEHRPCLEREFEIGRHLVTFSSPAEAREKAAYYLAHGSEREAIARAGQRHVLEHHTFENRCRRLLELAWSERG